MFELVMPLLPPALRERLIVAGVVDDQTLGAAVQRDEGLRRDLDRFMQDNKGPIGEAMLRGFHGSFLATRRASALLDLWQNVPDDLQPALLERVEATIAQETQAGNQERAAELRDRLDTFRLLLQEWEKALPVPPELQARLAAATDGAVSIEAAFAADPELHQEYNSLLEANSEMLGYFTVRVMCADVLTAQNLIDLWIALHQIPEELLEIVVGMIEQVIQEAEESGRVQAVELFRARLSWLKQVFPHREILEKQLEQWIQVLLESKTYVDLPKLAVEIRGEAEELFFAVAEQRVNDLRGSGEVSVANHLETQLSMLRYSLDSLGAALDTPLMRAIKAFLMEEDDGAAREVVYAHKDVLLTFEAHRILNQMIDGSKNTLKSERFERRVALLKELLEFGKEERLEARYMSYYDKSLVEADVAGKHHEINVDLGQFREVLQKALENDLYIAIDVLVHLSSIVGTFFHDSVYPDYQEILDLCNQMLIMVSKGRNIHIYGFIQYVKAGVLYGMGLTSGKDRYTSLLEALESFKEAYSSLQNQSVVDPLLPEIMANYATVLKDAAVLYGKAGNSYLYEALGLYDQILHRWGSRPTWLGVAQIYHNRANLLRNIAALPGEDCCKRLIEALDSHNKASRFIETGGNVFDYTDVLISKSMTLYDLSRLPGEDQLAWLQQSLECLDKAQALHQTEIISGKLVNVFSQRSIILLQMSELITKYQMAYLKRASDDCQKALQLITLERTPTLYARLHVTQGDVFFHLSPSSGDERENLLRKALSCYETALAVYSGHQHPFEFAVTLEHMAVVLCMLSSVSPKERLILLKKALKCAMDAVNVFKSYKDGDLESALNILKIVRILCYGDFYAIWSPDEDGPLPDRVNEYSVDVLMAALNIIYAIEELPTFWEYVPVSQRKPLLDTLERFVVQARQNEASSIFDSLRRHLLYLYILHLLSSVDNTPDSLMLLNFIDDTNKISVQGTYEYVADHPGLLRVDFEPLQTLLQTHFPDRPGCQERLAALRDALRLGQDHGVEELRRRALQHRQELPLVRQSEAALNHYLGLRKAASQSPQDAAVWLQAIAAGQAVLALAFDQNPVLNHQLICGYLAIDQTHLAQVYESARDRPAMLAALVRAVELAPNLAATRVNYAHGLITVGRLKEAAVETRIARRFDPELPELAALEARLAEAQRRRGPSA